MADSERLYSNSLVYTKKTAELFQEELAIMELQPLIQVHKFGFPLRLDFNQFLDCFQSLDSEKIKNSAKNDREHCSLILQSISSLNPTDYIVTDSKVFLKHDKERVMVSALWEKNGRSQRSYSRSRAHTCGELFPRGIGTSDILKKFTKTLLIENEKSNDNTIPEIKPSQYDIPIVQNDFAFENDEPEIMVCDENNQFDEVKESFEYPNLEGKGRALLVMMSSLGQYDKMIPITHCMRILFSSPMPDDMTMNESYLLQLTQAIDSFHMSQNQNEDVTL